MRDVKFRGRHLDKSGWIHGDLAHRDVQVGIAVAGYGVVYPVDPATVGQYTGLLDKSGREIYEGDILRGYSYPLMNDGEVNYFAEVVWFDNCPAFGIYTHKAPLSSVRGISDGNCAYMEDWEPDKWEIIGNIHDNPELLEAEED